MALVSGRRLLLAFVFAVVALALPAQRGDRAGEAQTPLPKDLVVPPANVRSPAEQLSTLRLPPGFTCELFASEPMIGDPVAATFDAAGRLWVVEMRNFMLDLDATDEAAPTGRVVVLEDDDGDHRADRATVYCDRLVLPRAVLPLRGGALVLTPPRLLWLPDADGDLRADAGAEQEVCAGFEAGIDNPEHCANGLLWGLDNRIHLAGDKRLLRWTPKGFVIEHGAGGGQWGITHDDRGRLYFNYNEDWLHVDLVPTRHGPAASLVGGLPQHNHRVCQDHTVWPSHITPGVNRGYQPGRLVDYKLAIHTAVCAPLIYRGGLLPGCDGDAFACEPAANLVRRIVLRDHDGRMQGANAYEAERQEFFASSDERCRPVNLATGPDGALYVVDMYRGVIQHKNFVTSFLRQQIVDRGLSAPTGLGRIWRLVPAGTSVPPSPSLPFPDADAAIAGLLHTNGAVRDLALRELVMQGAAGAAGALRERLAGDARPAVRIVLLAALQGLDRLHEADVRRALLDGDPGVVCFGLDLAGPFLAAGDRVSWRAVEAIVADLAARPNVRWHAALALGDVLQRAVDGARRERALRGLVTAASTTPEDAMLRGAVATASQRQLVEVLQRVLDAGEGERPRFLLLARDFAARTVRQRQAALQERVLALATTSPFAAELLRGALDALPKGAARVGWLRFASTPPALAQLAAAAGDPRQPLAKELLAAVTLVGSTAPGVVTQLTADEAARVRAGERVFAGVCAACHQLDGNGQQGLAPRLRDSEFVLGPPERLARIALFGLRGPLDIDGTPWNLEMPGQRMLNDDQLAQVLSYLRRAFGHQAAPVTTELVRTVREQHAGRSEPFTAQELLGEK
ncbi:MAG: c-type cytochrome [Planctomycetes bacterium]|nr:c-type cytochrome [Planctomycetota bacterium]